jgi:hypothetical protein
MDETSREIEEHIDRTRERLGSHLMELEHKVEAATDWREHFRARSGIFLGAAFIGGATLAIALQGRASRTVADNGESNRVGHDPGSAQAQMLEVWNNLKGALIGVAGARIKDYLGELMPGFDEHYRRAEQRTTPRDPAASFLR